MAIILMNTIIIYLKYYYMYETFSKIVIYMYYFSHKMYTFQILNLDLY